MMLKLVGSAQYRGQVGHDFVELQRGDTIKVNEDQARGLLEFPGWFEMMEEASPPAPLVKEEGNTAEGERQQRGGRRDRMQRGTAKDRELEEQSEAVKRSAGSRKIF